MANPVCAGMRRVPPVLFTALVTWFAGGPAIAQQTPPSEGGLSLDIEVVARQLDIARSEIQPSLGASVYDFSRQAIETQPQGDNQPFNRLLLQAPVSRRIHSASCMSAATTPICNSAST